MKLTKTQQELIATAKRYSGHYSIEAGGGRGAKGGRISYGSRERAALFALEKAGLVRITNRMSGNHWTGNGNTVFSTIWSFQLVEPNSAKAA